MVWQVGTDNIKLGSCAGETNQAPEAIGIGYHAGQNNQGLDALAIGDRAGNKDQGSYSIAIGPRVCEDNQHDKTIVLAAGGGADATRTTKSDALYIQPVRSIDASASGETGLQTMRYNPSSGEMTQSPYNGILGAPGLDGQIPTSTSVDSEGDLSVSFESGASKLLGNIKGSAGDVGPPFDGAGAPGTSVASASIDSNGDLIIELTDGSIVNVGNVDGSDGSDTTLISEVIQTSTGSVEVILTDGQRVQVGPPPGLPGTRGDGFDPTSSGFDGNGDLIITTTHGRVFNALSTSGLPGVTGATGPMGPAGSNATGGGPGSQGATGAQGSAGDAGPVGPTGSKGADNVGPTGPTGADGKDYLITEMTMNGVTGTPCLHDHLVFDGTDWVLGGGIVRLGEYAGVKMTDYDTNTSVPHDKADMEDCVYIGLGAGSSFDGDANNSAHAVSGVRTIGIGVMAARGTGEDVVAIGPNLAGEYGGDRSVFLGDRRGGESVDTTSVVSIPHITIGGTVGTQAGNAQSANSVSIGRSTAAVDYSIALGEGARIDEGLASICIGKRSTTNPKGEDAGAILLSPGHIDGEADIRAPAGLTINKVRNVAGPSTLYYNPTTFEVTYGSSAQETKTDIEAFSDSEMDTVVAQVLQLEPKLFKYLEPITLRDVPPPPPPPQQPVAATVNVNTESEPEPEPVHAPHSSIIAPNKPVHAPPHSTVKVRMDNNSAPGSVVQSTNPKTIPFRAHITAPATATVPETKAESQPEPLQRTKELEYCGLIANEVAEICPMLVHRDLDGNPRDIKWNDLRSILFEIIRRQSDALKSM